MRVLVASPSLLWSPLFAVAFPSGLESAALPVAVAVAVVAVVEDDDDDDVDNDDDDYYEDDDDYEDG